MATPAQNQAAITAAIQAAATADLAQIQSFLTAQSANFTSLQTAISTLAAAMSSTARQQTVVQIGGELAQAKADFLTLQSTTNAAQTAVPIA